MLAEQPQTSEEQTPPAKVPRLEFLDAAKGIGILCVIALHSSGRSARTLLSQGSSEWWVVTGFNRLMAFAVPMFLCVSAFLWARSAANKPGLTAGAVRRFTAILIPYLIWSLLFVLWQIYVERVPAAGLLTRKSIYNDLVWGKAYFHLYFLSILLQAAILFPLMIWLVRKTGFFVCCLLSLGIQTVVFILQTRFQFLPFPGTSVLWYVTSLLPAAWLGANWPVPPALLKRLLLTSVVLTLVAGMAYLWLEALEILKVTRYSGLANPVQQVFVFGGAFAVIVGLGLKTPSEKPKWRWMCWLGASSLPFYLVHPMIMRFLSGPRITQILQRIPLAPVFSYCLLVLATFAIVIVLNKLKLERLLFGRASPQLPIAIKKT